jgi:predicted peptidase
LIVFLHGQGESAPKPLTGVALQGPPQTAGRAPESLEYAVLSPQKPRKAQFYDEDVGAWIVGLVESYVAGSLLDASRIYLTGISQGGIGTWNLAARYPATFAAIAPVAGGLRAPMARAARALRRTPIWAFHAKNDAVLRVKMSDASVAACDAEDRSTPVKYDRPEKAAGSDPAWRAAGIRAMPGHGGMCEYAYYPPRAAGDPVPLYAWFAAHARAPT